MAGSGQSESANELPLLESHYALEDFAEPWNLSKDTLARLFEREVGVLVIETNRRGGARGRRYRTLRIPKSVAERVYRRLRIPPQNGRPR
jgi:uncharacterized protein YceH (UPF0502 family)